MLVTWRFFDFFIALLISKYKPRRMVRNHSYAWGWCFSYIWKRKMFFCTFVVSNTLRGSELDVRGMTTPCAYLRYALSHTRHNQHQYKWLEIVSAAKWTILIHFQSFLQFSLQYQMSFFFIQVTSVPRYNLHINLCLARGRTFPATSRLL